MDYYKIAKIIIFKFRSGILNSPIRGFSVLYQFQMKFYLLSPF